MSYRIIAGIIYSFAAGVCFADTVIERNAAEGVVVLSEGAFHLVIGVAMIVGGLITLCMRGKL